ncbi:uncharacterized protein LY89DRAFT_726526 [Mollisia scopiformis]|uniref:Uncharacterized protein n=1 Tax=Mollisia scopiformis TaxID=149040 RepID=A0A132B263_MOLSC|nr:uncharacterized protein LY89DRAFT_726526 [Mollisia scopiformis]KUJ06485.1 hypothetical protein LY89DRAFT_726526 [Mollisia scopiformis]
MENSDGAALSLSGHSESEGSIAVARSTSAQSNLADMTDNLSRSSVMEQGEDEDDNSSDTASDTEPREYIPGVVPWKLGYLDTRTGEETNPLNRRQLLLNSNAVLIMEAPEGKIYVREETKEDALRKDGIVAQRIEQQTRMLFSGHKTLCSCHYAICWGGCTSNFSTPFGVVGLALNHLYHRIPLNSYWRITEFWKMLAYWGIQMSRGYCGKLAPSLCQKDLHRLGGILMDDVKNVASGREGVLLQVLGLESAPHSIRQVAAVLAQLERDFAWLTHAEARAEQRYGRDRFLKQKIGEEAEITKMIEMDPHAKARGDLNRRNLRNFATEMWVAGQLQLYPSEVLLSIPLPSKAPSSKQSPAKKVLQKAQSKPHNGKIQKAPSSKRQGKQALKKSQDKSHNGKIKPARSAPVPIAISRYMERTYDDLAKMDSPRWAEVYEPGHLADLGLKVGDFGFDYQKLIEPTYLKSPFLTTNQRIVQATSWRQRLYVLLKRVPGNRMKIKVLHRMVQEWEGIGCTNTTFQTCSAALTRKPEFYWEPAETGRCWWLIAHEGKEYEKASGGRKPNLPKAEND